MFTECTYQRKPMTTPVTVVYLDEEIAIFSERCQPKSIGQFNGLNIKLTHATGECDWCPRMTAVSSLWSAGANFSSKCVVAIPPLSAPASDLSFAW
jgi:hypothetical protein